MIRSMNILTRAKNLQVGDNWKEQNGVTYIIINVQNDGSEMTQVQVVKFAEGVDGIHTFEWRREQSICVDRPAVEVAD